MHVSAREAVVNVQDCSANSKRFEDHTWGTPGLQDLLARDVLMSSAKAGQQQGSHGCVLSANSCGCVCCADQPYGQWSV